MPMSVLLLPRRWPWSSFTSSWAVKSLIIQIIVTLLVFSSTSLNPFSTCLVGANSVTSDGEAQALLSWRDSLNDSATLWSWDSSHDNKTKCSWVGITCSTQGHVTELNLQSMELLGEVPSQLKNLSSLKTLVLSQTNLSGTIPKEIGDYNSLVLLDLSSNRLSGRIPSEIARLKNLQTLILNSNMLEGAIPPEISQCSELVNLVIFDNELGGRIPDGIGKLKKLELVRAGGNANLEGPLPPELGNCTSLTMLGLAETRISGSIPSSFGNLKRLKTFAIYSAMLSGPLPPQIGEMESLENLYLYGNSLSGSIPKEIGRLSNLQKLFLWQNNLVGSIPSEIGNCSSLNLVDISINSLTGSVPSSIGKLENLVELQLSVNALTGSIPSSLVNCTKLTQIQFDTNHFTGPVPAELGEMKSLTLLYAWQNRLEGEIPSSLGNCTNLQGLDLSENNLTGKIPESLFQLKNLSKLLLLSNDLSGSLSPEIGNCLALARVRLANNRLSDSIPPQIGNLKNLYFLELENNQFSGTIPGEIGKCEDLQYLDLSGNLLSGSVPSTLGQLGSLQIVDISMNKLTGSIPARAFKTINKLMLNGNYLSGKIPSEIGDCKALQLLDLSNNRFSGEIPKEIGNMEGLNIALNLSWNYLSGPVPETITSLSKLAIMDLSHNSLDGNLSVLGVMENLVSLNVSYNNFSGPLPNTNFFRELPVNVLLQGNVGLCRDKEACFVTFGSSSQPKHYHSDVKLIISLLFSITTLLLLLGIYMMMRTKRIHEKHRREQENDPELGWPWQMTLYQKLSISVEDIVENLINDNIIGEGCSGVVYKVHVRGSGDTIAVKKLWTSNKYTHGDREGRDSFVAEVRTLGAIRHRNIVRMLGFCCNKSTRLLMYDYMPNGSLGELLHERRGVMLEWEIRYKILLGSAQGLAYLHHDCSPAIVHRDIKANNILLGPRYEPVIADFGLAKLLEPSEFTKSSCTSVAGSYGYIAPEYGYSMKVTEKSDVYSYGVMLLEVLTGRPPIDPSFREGTHIVEWVKESVQRNRNTVVEEVLDPRLQGRPDTQIQEMLQALGTAFLCVNPNPEERPTMKNIAALLTELRHDTTDGAAGKLNSATTTQTNNDVTAAASSPTLCKSISTDRLRSLVLSSASSTINSH